MDRRRHFANDRVAHRSLTGPNLDVAVPNADVRQVSVPVADLCRSPNGPRDRQVLFGEDVAVLEIHDGWAFAATGRDAPHVYVGYIRAGDLAEGNVTPTHWVTARASHLYPAPDFKARETLSLSFGSGLQVLGASGRFCQTPFGYVPRAHLRERGDLFDDPVAIAERVLGTPYLWGGNSAFGIDCSGLVQMACLACGIACPGDSDMQEAELGATLPEDATLRRGDLLFWAGHVGWVAADNLLLHATAHHMAVAYEPLDTAIARIKRQGDGDITRRARLGKDEP